MMANPSAYSRLFGLLTCVLLLCLAGCGETPAPAGSADKQAKPQPPLSPQVAPKAPSKPAAIPDESPPVTAPSLAKPAIPSPPRKIEITHETIEEHSHKSAAENAPAAPPAQSIQQGIQKGKWGEDLVEVAGIVEAIRGLKFKTPVPSEQQSLADFEKFVRAELAKEFPPEKLTSMMRGLVRLGVVKRPFDLGEDTVKALLSQAAAYYNPETGAFYVLFEDLQGMMADLLSSHELTHALQDQHYNLKKLIADLQQRPGGVRNDDRVLAVRYLLEGEATYVMTVYPLRLMGLKFDDQKIHAVLQQQANMSFEQIVALTKLMSFTLGDRMKAAAAEIDKIPPYIMMPMLDAYMGGAVYVSRLRLRGGWKAVDAAYKNLPESVEQCLHPARQSDKPTRLKLPPLATLTAAGWQPVDAAIHGESYLTLLLKNVGADDATARAATAGWDGDIYRAYVKGERVMVVLATTWDDAREAREYYAAHSRGLKQKGYQGAEFGTEGAGRRFAFTCGKPTDTGILLLRGREVFLVEGADKATCKRILRDLKAMKIKYRK